ncbi:chalcone isomerase family protein [Cupriavidus sp. CER94]|uniref:chalcone isomerase family protein n=1 Tax=Cupriavidus sp. CER94 TaxID=3377036 RepID=UPI00381B3F58
MKSTPSSFRRATPARRLAVSLCATLALGLLLPSVSAMEIDGVRFDDMARLGGRQLSLNGTGLRQVFVIKGYAAGLYLPERARNATVVLGSPGPKRLQIRPLREVESAQFVKALNEGLRENHSELQMQLLSERVTQLERTMSQLGTAQRGDIINFDFTPNGGTAVTLNGIPRGQAIPGEDFYQAVLRIFLGEHPVDRNLKRGLLGG